MNREIAKKNAELLLWMAEDPGVNKCQSSGNLGSPYFFFSQGISYTDCGLNRRPIDLLRFLTGEFELTKIKPKPKPITWQEAIERMLDGKPVSRKGCGPIMKNPFLEGEYFGIPIKVREIEWQIPPE